MTGSSVELGRQFVEAFNRRDPDGLVAVSHPVIGVVADGLLIEVRGYLTDIATVRQVHGIPR